MSDLKSVQEKIFGVIKHYNSETAKILAKGPINLSLEVYYKPEDDVGTEVDVSALTQEDIDVIKTKRNDLCPWIKDEVRNVCNIGVDVEVLEDTATSITFRLQASPEYRAH